MELNPYEPPIETPNDTTSGSALRCVWQRKWFHGSLLTAAVALGVSFLAHENASRAMATMARAVRNRARGEVSEISSGDYVTANVYSRYADTCSTVSLCLWAIGWIMLACSAFRREPARRIFGVASLIACGLFKLLLV